MGVDIHIYCEHYNKESKRWESLNLYKRNSDNSFEPIPIYDGRNSELFSLLADVGGGFYFPPRNCGCLVEPRGLPDNLSLCVQLEWEDGKDEEGKQRWFSPTWYDYCELDNYLYFLKDFNKELKKKNRKIAELKKEIYKLKYPDEDDGCGDWFCDDVCEDDEDDCNVIDSLEGFVNCVRDVLRRYEIWHPKPNEVRVIMWFDH